jgi:hypothetical protein
MPGFNCAMRVYITRIVPVMETHYVAPCEGCFVSEDYTAAKYGALTILLKEPLKRRWEYSLYSLKMVRAQKSLHVIPASHTAMCSTISAACIWDSPLHASSIRGSTSTGRALLGLLRPTVEERALLPDTADNAVKRICVGSLRGEYFSYNLTVVAPLPRASLRISA